MRKSKKGQQGGPQLSLTTLIGVVLGVIVVVFLLSVGMKAYNALFGEPEESPGQLTTFDTVAEILSMLDNKEFIASLDKDGYNYRSCLVPFTWDEEERIMFLDKNQKDMIIVKFLGGVDNLWPDKTVPRPRYCSLKSGCMVLCTTDCVDAGIKQHASFPHITSFIKKKYPSRWQTLIHRMEIASSHPSYIVNFKEAYDDSTTQSCVAMRDEMKARLRLFSIKPQPQPEPASAPQ